MIERRLERLWAQLQGKKPHLPHFLSALHLDGIRGFYDLRVTFNYPVSVIAGGNATGKSTVLFAAACAYRVPGAGVRDYVPSTLFPDYLPTRGGHRDAREEIKMDFYYHTPEGPREMRWRRAKQGRWSRSFSGRRGGHQPERQVYLRTLSNLSNPAEVRGVLGMSRLKSQPEEFPLNAAQIDFVQQMLPFRYAEVVKLSSGNKNLLFATQEGGAKYSELHMAAGERALLRLAQEIAQIEDALVLIDEVEAGLHPWVQQLLMLQLQQLALRNNLQIVVTTHSPVVLDSIPRYGRIFLDRDETSGQVVVREPYRDVVQNALYGRAMEALNLLCEDEAAEGILQGVLDFLIPRDRLQREAIRVGRDTGASEFPMHAEAFRKFGQIQNTVFVLDGDQVGSDIEAKIRDAAKRTVQVLFLPGSSAPEAWVWDKLRTLSDEDAAQHGINKGNLLEAMNRLDAVYALAVDRASEIAKTKFRNLSEHLNRDTPDICRIVARLEAMDRASDIQPLVGELSDILSDWRE